MDLQQSLSGVVLFLIGVAGIGISWVLTEALAAGVGVLSVVFLSVGVLLIGVEDRAEEKRASS
jgi:hypothetical protein